MNRLQKALGIGALVLALSGCKEPDYVNGTVVAEKGTVNGWKPTYAIQIQTPQGLYTTSITEGCMYYSKTLPALELAIKEGTKVKIDKQILESGRFGKERIGSLTSDEVIIADNQ